MEHLLTIGPKSVIYGGLNSSGNKRFFIYIPQRIVDILELKSGDEVEIGTILKTERNVYGKRGFMCGKSKADRGDEKASEPYLHNDEKVIDSSSDQSSESRSEVESNTETEQLQ